MAGNTATSTSADALSPNPTKNSPRRHQSYLLPSIRHCPGALLHCCSDAPFCSSVQVTHDPLEPSPKWIPRLLLNLRVPICNPIPLRGTVRVPRPSPGLWGSQCTENRTFNSNTAEISTASKGTETRYTKTKYCISGKLLLKWLKVIPVKLLHAM